MINQKIPANKFNLQIYLFTFLVLLSNRFNLIFMNLFVFMVVTIVAISLQFPYFDWGFNCNRIYCLLNNRSTKKISDLQLTN